MLKVNGGLQIFNKLLNADWGGVMLEIYFVFNENCKHPGINFGLILMQIKVVSAESIMIDDKAG